MLWVKYSSDPHTAALRERGYLSSLGVGSSAASLRRHCSWAWRALMELGTRGEKRSVQHGQTADKRWRADSRYPGGWGQRAPPGLMCREPWEKPLRRSEGVEPELRLPLPWPRGLTQQLSRAGAWGSGTLLLAGLAQVPSSSSCPWGSEELCRTQAEHSSSDVIWQATGTVGASQRQ